VDQGQKVRRNQAFVDLRRVVIRLRVVAVDLGDAARRDVLLQKALPVADGEAEVVQAALVAAAGGIADDDRQHVDAVVVVVGTPDGALEEEAAVAADCLYSDQRRGPPAVVGADVDAERNHCP
jgi:hypothetical protein